VGCQNEQVRSYEVAESNDGMWQVKTGMIHMKDKSEDMILFELVYLGEDPIIKDTSWSCDFYAVDAESNELEHIYSNATLYLQSEIVENSNRKISSERDINSSITFDDLRHLELHISYEIEGTEYNSIIELNDEYEE